MAENLEKIPSELSDNFIVSLYQVSASMENNAHAFVEGANKREKDLEDNWKVTNAKKAHLQKEDLAGIYRNMAIVSTLLLVISVGASVGGTILSAGANPQTGKLLSDVGSLASNQGNTVAQNVSAIYTQNTNSLIETLGQNAQKVWEADKRDNETRKEDLNGLKRKINDGTQAAMEKAATAYSIRG